MNSVHVGDGAGSVSCSTQVAVVGGGPIGLELAVALKHAGIPFQVFEAGNLGHTVSWWAPQTRWFSSNERIAIAGVPLLTEDQSKSTREQYLNYLRGVATQFQLDIRTQTSVKSIQSLDSGFELTTVPRGGDPAARREVWHADSVVLATGGTDFPKRLGIPGEDLPHVDGYLRETHRYFNRRVLVIGGRNSAIEAALRLHHAGARVTLSYRGRELPERSIKYWLLPEIKGLLRSGRIRPMLATEPIEITPGQVRLRDIGEAPGPEQLVEVDDVLALIGYEQDKTLFRNIGVELIGDMQRPSFDEATMETNVEGIFVAGTAVAGTQSSSYKVFLENCHEHVDTIVAHLSGRKANTPNPAYQQQAVTQPET
ncbi:MAG: NAD(P)-binding domain-containing protein [Planctomycetota bacterium]